jgi:uncharacterized protein YgiM (DUF1202 family)
MTIRTQWRRTWWAGLAPVVLALMLAACGPSAEPPLPTRTPAPTFTPTAESAPAAVEAPPSVPQEPAQNPQAADRAQPAEGPPPTPAPAQELAPADTPTPEPAALVAEVVANANMNVRGGPGTNYNIIGAATQGQRFPVTGKNQDSTWWQIDYNGQPGWVFGDLVTQQNTQSVAVAVNIPAPPPPTATPIPQPTAVPQPQEPTPAPAPAEPAPAPQPAPEVGLEFSRAILQRCDPNAGVTYVQGTTYKNGQPVNGYNVAFSYAPDGPVVASIVSGPHAGYTNWNTGFYSHILKTDGPREGNWFFWIVDGGGKRISAIANVQTHGEAGEGKCQQAVIDFDS